MRTRLIVVGAVLRLTALLGGCTPTAEPSNTPTATTEPSLRPVETTAPSTAEAGATAGWIIDGILIGVVTMGSSTCIPEVDPTTLTTDGDTLAVTLKDPGDDRVCTADLGPRVTAVGVQQIIDAAEPFHLEVTYNDATTTIGLLAVERVPEEDMWESAAGYVGPNTIGLVTFGSSSCPPHVGSVEPGADAAALTVTLEPSEIEACTDDLAPRILAIFAEPGVKKLTLVQDQDKLTEIDVLANAF